MACREMKKITEKIHQSDIYGVFIETGCGVPISEALFNVAGASNTVYFSQSPYSREFFHTEYNIKNTKVRSVSPECLQGVLESEKISNLFESKKINTLYVSSFQVGDESNSISTHGWILFKYKENIKYYHISIHEKMTREDYIKRICENGLKLINSKNEFVPEECDVDIILNYNLSYNKKRTLQFISKMNHKEQFSVFYKDKIDRLESLTRENNSLIIFKGSFKPVQIAHKYIIERSKAKYNTNAVFMISVNVFQKGRQNEDSVLNRIDLLNELGYPVIVCSKPFFKDNISFIRNKFDSSKKIILAMGLDTVNRLMDDYKNSDFYDLEKMKKDFKNTVFFCFNREGSHINDFIKDNSLFYFEKTEFEEISSTKIRESLKNNEYEEIKKIVPFEVYNKVIENNWDI